MIDLEEAYSWLYYRGIQESRLSPYSELLVNQLQDAIRGDQLEQAWSKIEHLESLRKGLSDESEVATILTECGRSAYKLGNNNMGVRYLREAISRFLWHEHQVSVVQWMLGWILWQSPENHTEAIRLWQQSIGKMHTLFQSTDSEKLAGWYQDRWQRMDKSLLQAMAKDSVMASPPPKWTPPVPPPASIAKALPKVTWDFLQTLAVSEEIPAGGFGPTGADPNPVDYIEVEQVKLGGSAYHIHGLRGSRLVKLSPTYRYTVLKVMGDSMDQEDIQDGDYVLMRVQDTANDNDIVAAEIVLEDTRATLKRFTRQGRKIVLMPNSSNPANTPHEFSISSKGEFYIRGVILAVLKPE